jgi:hypothetical protein
MAHSFMRMLNARKCRKAPRIDRLVAGGLRKADRRAGVCWTQISASSFVAGNIFRKAA